MRLKDKLIRKNCPACDEEITLGSSSLNRKINCPKCRQTVIIPDGGAPIPPVQEEKPSPKKAVPKEKRTDRPLPAQAPATAMPEPRITIQSFHPGEETPAPMESGATDSRKKDVLYCLCNGRLRKCADAEACCCSPTMRSIYSGQTAF
jgi:hypothetical protein